MEDDNNTSSEDETQESPSSPRLGAGKKLKLNDGSSQDSFKETETASSSKDGKDENADSGVSADKSESTSSDDRGAAAASEPVNEVVNAGPSSGIHAILLNFRRPIRSRNYRKRKTPDRDAGSNDSSRDSDDLSIDETPQEPRPIDNSNSDGDSDELQRFIDTCSESSSTAYVHRHDWTSDSDNSMSQSNDNYDSDDVRMQSGDTDSSDGGWQSRLETENADENKGKPPDVLLKQRPKHTYFLLREILNREMGLTLCHKANKEDVMFEQRFYGSLHVVYRLKKLHHLNKHRGCVNSINFHPEGHLLASGSDDMNVIVWDWGRNVALQSIKTGHKSNVFQSKFLYLNARVQLNIVTCARDGQVRLVQCPSSGGGCVSRRRLASHARAAHKLHVTPAEPHSVVSAGEDGLVMHADVRAEHATRLFVVKEHGVSIPLYSVHGHPLNPRALLVAGKDRFVRVYDTRHAARPAALYCPRAFTDKNNAKKRPLMHLTCAVYNHDGSEILGSYNDQDIYLFDAVRDVYDKDNNSLEQDGYTHRYSGHRNSATFKAVAFFGPKSQYVVSGSDCSYIYVWDKKTESIVQWMQGDTGGVVNCIEAHPRSPVLASSGLDRDVKIWLPRAHHDPDYTGLHRVVRENSSPYRSPLFNDFLPTLYSAWQNESRLYADDESASYGGNIEFDGNVCTAM